MKHIKRHYNTETRIERERERRGKREDRDSVRCREREIKKE